MQILVKFGIFDFQKLTSFLKDAAADGDVNFTTVAEILNVDDEVT